MLEEGKSLTVDDKSQFCYTVFMMKKGQHMKQVKKNRFAKMREIMKEYGFPLCVVMCGKVENGRFYLTNRTKP